MAPIISQTALPRPGGLPQFLAFFGRDHPGDSARPPRLRSHPEPIDRNPRLLCFLRDENGAAYSYHSRQGHSRRSALLALPRLTARLRITANSRRDAVTPPSGARTCGAMSRFRISRCPHPPPACRTRSGNGSAGTNRIRFCLVPAPPIPDRGSNGPSDRLTGYVPAPRAQPLLRTLLLKELRQLHLL